MGLLDFRSLSTFIDVARGGKGRTEERLKGGEKERRRERWEGRKEGGRIKMLLRNY